jgi:hypothetical protein
MKLFRTLLFAPATRPELLSKAQAGNADALIFDLEDSVPANAKDDARRNVARRWPPACASPCTCASTTRAPATSRPTWPCCKAATRT